LNIPIWVQTGIITESYANGSTVKGKHLKVSVFWLNVLVLVTYTHTGQGPSIGVIRGDRRSVYITRTVLCWK